MTFTGYATSLGVTITTTGTSGSAGTVLGPFGPTYGVQCWVYDFGTLNLATITDSAGNSLANPFFVNPPQGSYTFEGAALKYSLLFNLAAPAPPPPPVPSIVQIPSFAQASLPPSGSAFAGSLARVTNGSRGLWIDSGTQWFSASGQVCNVREFGAVGDGVTDDLAAFDAAVAALGGGGCLRIPFGSFYLSATWDTTPCADLIVQGSGQRNTVLISGATNTPGIIVATAATRNSRLADLSLTQAAYITNGSPQTPPVSARAGNYGITTQNAGAGAGFILDRVDVRYFADSLVHIAGPTGPCVVRDCYLYFCAGYGVEVETAGGQSPEDVRIEGGANQFNWGGILASSGGSLLIIDPDIELGDVGKYPAIYARAGTSVTIIDTSVSVGANAITVPAGVIVLEGECHGSTIIGGINFANNGTNNLLFGEIAGADHLTVIGGTYTNKTPGGGYFCEFTGAVAVTFINPFLVSTMYTAGKDIVHDVTANFVTAIGVKCASVAGSTVNTPIFAGGVAAFGPADATSFTVVGGIITAIS